MINLKAPETKENFALLAAFVILLVLAFFQCYRTIHDLHWAYDPDFDRDIAFARGVLEGNFGKDPNYAGEYIWYNPLLFSVEAGIAKLTGLPLNLIAARAGVWLNLLGPISFFTMVSFLFNRRVALAAALGFLFLTNGNILCWGSATYSPWLYPVCFNQFVFYLNILFCYKAFTSQKYSWFLLLGASTGFNFLGHSAPAVLMILILITLQTGNIITALRQRQYPLIKKYLLQGVTAAVAFVVIASPLLYFVVGKYHLHIINRETIEYTEGIFYWSNFVGLFKANISIPFLIAIAGGIWFHKNVHQPLIRRIIWSWLILSFGSYIWASFVAGMDHRFHIQLPGTVPAFHYFFYFKALQSVFFGLGFIYLASLLLNWIGNLNRSAKTNLLQKYPAGSFILLVLLIAFAYFPVYAKRQDFVQLRDQALTKEHDKDDIEVFNYITQHIPSDNVILCGRDYSIFPVMATARKMVCINTTFSNAYLDFDKREADRANMLLFLQTGQLDQARSLLSAYNVSILLITNKELEAYKSLPSLFGPMLLKNDTYTMYPIHIPETALIKP